MRFQEPSKRASGVGRPGQKFGGLHPPPPNPLIGKRQVQAGQPTFFLNIINGGGPHKSPQLKRIGPSRPASKRAIFF